MSTSSNETIRELSPDRPLAKPIVEQVMHALNQHEEAAYKVWLLLSTKYGSGQKLWR